MRSDRTAYDPCQYLAPLLRVCVWSNESVRKCVCVHASGDSVEVVMVWRVHHSPSPMNSCSMRGVSDLRNRGMSGWGSFSQNCVCVKMGGR